MGRRTPRVGVRASRMARELAGERMARELAGDMMARELGERGETGAGEAKEESGEYGSRGRDVWEQERRPLGAEAEARWSRGP